MTLEGTVIHKSGLITGGRSTHNSNKKWDEKDVQGENLFVIEGVQLIDTHFSRPHPCS